MRESLSYISLIAFGAFPLVAAAPQPLAPHFLEKLHDKVQGVLEGHDAENDKKDVDVNTLPQVLSDTESVSFAKRQLLTTVTVETPKVVTETQYIIAPPVVSNPTPIETSCSPYETYISEPAIESTTLAVEESPCFSETPSVTVISTVLPSSDDFDCTSSEIFPETSSRESEAPTYVPEPSSHEPETSAYEPETSAYEPETSDPCTSELDLPASTTSDCLDIPYPTEIYWTSANPEYSETASVTDAPEPCDSSLLVSEPTVYPLLGPELFPHVRGSVDSGVLQAVKDAYNENERIENLLACGDDSEFVFDFSNPPVEAIDSNIAGTVVLADRSSFPALYDSGVAVALFELAPCAVVAPHTHSRAAESILVTDGQLHTQFVLDSNLPVVTNHLSKNQATVFPQGSFHYEFNPTCEPASFVSSFSNDDPGISLIAPGFFSFEDEALRAAFGGAPLSAEHLESIRESIPPSVITSAQECLARCGGSLGSSSNELAAGSVSKLNVRSFDDEYMRSASYESDQDDDLDTQLDSYHTGLSNPRYDSRQYLEDHAPVPNRFPTRQYYGPRRSSDRHNTLSDAQDRIRYREYVLMEISSILKEMAYNDLEVSIPERRVSRDRIASIAKRDITPWDIREKLAEFLSNDSDTHEEHEELASDEVEDQRKSRITRLLSYLNGELERAENESSTVEPNAEDILQKRSEPSAATSVQSTTAGLPNPSDVFNGAHLKQVFPGDSVFPHHAPQLPPGFNAGPQFQQVSPQFPPENRINGPVMSFPQPVPFDNNPHGPAQHFTSPNHMNQHNSPFTSYQNDLAHNNEEESPSKLREFLNWIRGNSDDHQENFPVHNELVSEPYRNRPYPPPPVFPDKPFSQDRYMSGRVNGPMDRMEQRLDRERNWEKEKERQREYERPPPPERFSRRPDMRFRPDIYDDDFDDDNNYYYFEDYDWTASLNRRDVQSLSADKTLETTEDQIPSFLDVGPVETIPIATTVEVPGEELGATEKPAGQKSENDNSSAATIKTDSSDSVTKLARDTNDGLILDEEEAEVLSWWSALWRRIFGAYPSDDSDIVEDPSSVTDDPSSSSETSTTISVPTTVSTTKITLLSSIATTTIPSTIIPLLPTPTIATSFVTAPGTLNPIATAPPTNPATDGSEIISGDASWWAYVADSVDQLRNAVGAGKDSERWAEIKKVLDEGGLARAQEARERNDERLKATLEKLREQFGTVDATVPAELSSA